MTISHDTIHEVAPDVTPKAQERRDIKNPFITLQSLESLCQGETLQLCLEDVAMHSLRYAETVCRFQQIVGHGQQSNEDGTREEIEKVRSSTHDACIASINILSRSMKKAGKNNDWITKLSSGGRAAYGKFAILLAFEIVLQEKEK